MDKITCNPLCLVDSTVDIGVPKLGRVGHFYMQVFLMVFANLEKFVGVCFAQRFAFPKFPSAHDDGETRIDPLKTAKHI
jgi:hypothetical protein